VGAVRGARRAVEAALDGAHVRDAVAPLAAVAVELNARDRLGHGGGLASTPRVQF
jgi:hypothetical protein